MHIPEQQDSIESSSSILFTGLIGFVIAILGFVIIGPIVGILAAMPFYSGSLLEFSESIQAPLGHPELRVPLFIFQGCAALIGLIVLPLLFLYLRRQQPLQRFFSHRSSAFSFLLTAVVVITFMGFNSWIIEWNANVHLPYFLEGFETWARDKEDMAALLTKFLTTFDNTGQFILAFFVIAIIPAIGEELAFRGILQGYLRRSGMNAHVAIWLAAFLFSAIHFQFFGFFPRLFLGALFGYLYYWSGNLWVPVLAHFVNNCFTLIMVYLNQLQLVDMNIEEPESTSLSAVLIFSIITIALLIVLHRHFLNKSTHGKMEEGV